MPCTKLSSGKTVCYGDEPTTYSQGGTIFFNHQPVHFPDGGKTLPPIYTSDRNDPRLKSYQDSVYVRTKSDQTFQKGTKTRPLTEKEKKEWRDERTGLLPNVVEYNYTPTNKYDYYGHYKKPVQPVIYKPIERTTLEPVESRTVPMLESNFEPTPITPMSVDRPMMQPSNEEYNRQYSIFIPTIEINKRQVAPRVNRVLGQNRVNPKNQYQRSIDFGSRELPVTDEYKLNQLRMKLGMEPKGFQDGGEVDLKLNRVPKPVKDDFDMSGGFEGNLFHNVGARGELNYGPLNMSGQAMLSGYDKGWNPNVSSNLSTNVQLNPKLNVSGNLNYNYNKGEGSQFSPTIGASYQANPNLNISGSFTPGSNSASFSIRKKFSDGGKTIKLSSGKIITLK